MLILTVRRAAAGLALLTAFGAVPPARGGDLSGWLAGDTLTGNWGGLRDRLDKMGIDSWADFTTELAGNPIGGQRQGFRYTHELDFGVDVDLGKLAELRGTKLHLSFSDYAGHSLSQDRIGNIFDTQEDFDGPADFRLAELSIEQSLLDGRLNIRVGRIGANQDFALIDVACNFQNAAFCDVPGALGENSGFPAQPIVGWGGRFRLGLDEAYLQAGAYEVNPTLVDPSNSFKLSTSGATGAFVPVEIGWNPEEGPFGLAGEYRLGAYWDTSDTEDVSVEIDGSGKVRSGRWGLYLLGQQQVYREPGSTGRGLTLFAGLEVGDSHTAEIRWFVEGGVIYQGTFPGRDADTVNLGFAYGHINGRQIDAEKNANKDDPGSEAEQSAEAVVELNYAAQVTPFLQLTPGLQIIVNPGADSDVPTALVLGFRSAVTF